MRSRSAFLNAACASQILEKQAVKCGGAPVPVHSRHHQRLRGVGFKWNWRRCCIWFALLQMAINARDASACASTFAARSASPPHPRDADFLLEPTPASLLPAVPRAPVAPWCSPRPFKAFAASRARRLGFFAGLLVSVALSPKNESFSHSLVTNRRISSSDGSAPKTMRRRHTFRSRRAPPARPRIDRRDIRSGWTTR